MGLLAIVYVPLAAILTITLKLSVCMFGFKYFMVDTVITGFVFVYGSIFLWDMKMPWDILTRLWMTYYMLLRFVTILVLSIKMKVKKQNIISNNSIKARRLLVINIYLNIFTFIGACYQIFQYIRNM